ncbi:MAG: M61 family metallopeptidase [Fimbriimonadaceae bacterium]|nr:M61 family metallopeptidase [Fimbriimonadaceae bacterium]
MVRTRGALLLGLAVLATACSAEIRYTVGYQADPSNLLIAMDISPKGSETVLQMPKWAPGSYRLTNNHENAKELSARDEAGRTLTVAKPDDNTWVVNNGSARRVTVTYRVPATKEVKALHWSGPSTYLYVRGRTEEDCRLRLLLLPGWKAAVGLDPVDGERATYQAPSYDVLADNPVTLGEFVLDEYTAFGKPHFIAYRGAPAADVDRNYVRDICKRITEFQGAFFGGSVPYNRYVWHFRVNDAMDGAGGLEHLSSTQISLASGVGPRAVSVLSHEFFHLWNVKRIRSNPLGPFDYQQLPVTGALWWLEGVTDYYAHLLLFRYGVWDEMAFHEDIASNIRTATANAAYKEVSADESSRRVREAANGRGNSQGWRISYYTLGWLVGMCLDTELRARTNGRYSLDDVIRALWEMCRDDRPGFEEDAIRKLCVQFGGPEMGTYYDSVVLQAGKMDFDAQLAKMGLEFADVERATVDLGFRWAYSASDKAIAVTGTPTAEGLQRGDVIVAVNGAPIATDRRVPATRAVERALADPKGGQPIRLRVRRGETVSDVIVTPKMTEGKARVIRERADVTREQRALRAGWYYGNARRN